MLITLYVVGEHHQFTREAVGSGPPSASLRGSRPYPALCFKEAVIPLADSCLLVVCSDPQLLRPSPVLSGLFIDRPCAFPTRGAVPWLH